MKPPARRQKPKILKESLPLVLSPRLQDCQIAIIYLRLRAGSTHYLDTKGSRKPHGEAGSQVHPLLGFFLFP